MKYLSACRGKESRISIICISAFLVCAIVLPAQAQFGFAGQGLQGLSELSKPDFTRRDLPKMVNTLNLDENQRQIVEAFLEDHEQTFREEGERIRDEMQIIREDIRDSNRSGGSNWRERIAPLVEKMDSFRQRRKEMREELINQVKSVLYEEQLEAWPSYERVTRRDQLLPKGVLSGERVDLFVVLQEAPIDEANRITIEPLLVEYEIELDNALTQRELITNDVPEALRQVLTEQDFDKAEKLSEKMKKSHVRVRDINDNYARLILDLLNEPEEFKQIYRETAYSRVYDEIYSQLAFKSALDFEEIDQDTRQAILNLKSEFENQLAAINENLTRTLHKEEPKRFERTVKIIKRRLNGEEINFRIEDPIRLAMNERSAFEDRMIKSLHVLLSPDQIDALPPNPRRPGQNLRFPEGRRPSFLRNPRRVNGNNGDQ